MLTFLAALCGGIVSVAIALFLGQPLQHYFWTRQRHAERQLAVIEEVNKPTAEVQFLLLSGEDVQPRNERLSLALAIAIANVRALFSPAAAASFQSLHPLIAEALRLPPESPREQRLNLGTRLMASHHVTMILLYRGLGIPAPPPGKWMQEYVWRPIRIRIWNQQQRYWRARRWIWKYAWRPIRVQIWRRPRRYWRNHSWPMLQRWGA
jgi:hypothetical protein